MRALPPDHTSRVEWPIWLGIAGSLTRATPEGVLVLVFFCFLLMSYLLVHFTVKALARLWDIYQTRATTNTRSAKVLRISAIVLLVLWACAALLSRNPETVGKALVLFSGSLFVFTLIYEGADWLAERQEQTYGGALPENISLADVISWKESVDTQAEPLGQKRT